MSPAVYTRLLFCFICLYISSSSHLVKGFYTASSVTTTETPAEYEFLKIQTTIAPPMALVSSDQQTTTESPARLNSLLSVCDDDGPSEDKDDQRSTGEEAAEEDKRILHYVSALKDTDRTVQPQTASNFSSAENSRVVTQQKLPLPSEEVETEEVFPMTMIKSFRVADFGEMKNNQIEQLDSVPRYLPASGTTPLKLPVFTRYSLEARPFTRFQSASQGDNYDQRSSYEEPLLNEIINDIEPQVIEVLPGNFRPLEIHFKSSSRRIKLVQKPSEKDSQQRELEITRSEEEPQRLRHTVHKPIIQEVREIIIPQIRKVQEILPVEETFHTIVSTRTNKFNTASNERSRPTMKSESYRAAEPVLATSSPATPQLLPIVESLADVENQVLEQSSSKEEPVLASQTSIRPLTVSAPRQLRRKPIFTTDNLLNSYLKPTKGSGEEDDLIYQHLRSKKYRRNVTIKKRKSTRGGQQQRQQRSF